LPRIRNSGTSVPATARFRSRPPVKVVEIMESAAGAFPDLYSSRLYRRGDRPPREAGVTSSTTSASIISTPW
jgi:hypothetical protein